MLLILEYSVQQEQLVAWKKNGELLLVLKWIYVFITQWVSALGGFLRRH